MATDPQTLIAEGKCYTCQGVSESEAIELALLARWASLSGCVNLIPAGQHYDHTQGVFILTGLTIGHTYSFTFGVNEDSFVNGGDTISSPGVGITVQFTSNTGEIFIISVGPTPDILVTAIVC